MAFSQTGSATLFPGTPNEVWGLCSSLQLTQERDKIQIRNQENNTVAVLYSAPQKHFSAIYEPLRVSGSSPVTEDDLVGQTLEVQTNDSSLLIHIESATLLRTEAERAEFRIQGYYYPHLEATE